MAKVMISMPDDLLDKLDARADVQGESRSGLLRRLVEDELAAGEDRQLAEIERLLDLATAPMGGEGAKLIREARDSR